MGISSRQFGVFLKPILPFDNPAGENLRTIIAGSRSFNDFATMQEMMETVPWTISAVLNGTAPGADTMGAKWAKHNQSISVINYPAPWEEFGRRAGMMRNIVMADNADALVAIWDGRSRGTAQMIEEATKRNLVVQVIKFFNLTERSYK